VESCLARIEELEPLVRAWVIVDRAGARDQARRLDAELAAGNWRGPLHGIPIGIKDLVDVAGFVTAAGSPLLADNVAARDATLVARLRQAGAVILGKTVTTQFASFDPPATRNPWNFERTPGGSSSGSAAAVACGMCLGAIGSQTGGSITRPASYCGVAGCKPTYGRVSTAGVMPLAPSMDHPGPIGRSVHDLAILLDAIAGPDARDPLCSAQPYARVAEQCVATLHVADEAANHAERRGAIERPLRLGVLGGLFSDLAHESARESLMVAIDMLRSCGAAVSEVALPASFADVLRSHRVIMSVEAAAEHEPQFRRYPKEYLPKIRGLVEEGLRAAAPDYVRAKRHQQVLSRDILTCFRGVDVLVTPAALGPAPDTSTTGDPALNSPWSFTGLPTVSFPIGLATDGLPVGIQLVGRSFGELDLMLGALWCQQTLNVGHRKDDDAAG
jgi:aspartyl-tRNA(Asn)/glutamyl-tRNA(Gln) amidotransferase subunit A